MPSEPYHMKSSRSEWSIAFQGAGHSRCSRCGSLLCKHTAQVLRVWIVSLIKLKTSGEDLVIKYMVGYMVSLEKSHLEKEELQETE